MTIAAATSDIVHSVVTGPFTVTLSTSASAIDVLTARYDRVADKRHVVNFQKGF